MRNKEDEAPMNESIKGTRFLNKILITLGVFVVLLGIFAALYLSSIGDTYNVSVNQYKARVRIEKIKKSQHEGVVVSGYVKHDSDLTFWPVYLMDNKLSLFENSNSVLPLSEYTLPGEIISSSIQGFEYDLESNLYFICNVKNSFKLIGISIDQSSVADLVYDKKNTQVFNVIFEKDIDSDKIVTVGYESADYNVINNIICQSIDQKVLYFLNEKGDIVDKIDFKTKVKVDFEGSQLTAFDGQILHVLSKGVKIDIKKSVPVEKTLFCKILGNDVWFYDGENINSYSLGDGKLNWSYKAPGLKKSSLGLNMYQYDLGTFQLVSQSKDGSMHKFCHLSDNKHDFFLEYASHNAIAGFQDGDIFKLFFAKIKLEKKGIIEWDETFVTSITDRIIDDNGQDLRGEKFIYKIHMLP